MPEVRHQSPSVYGNQRLDRQTRVGESLLPPGTYTKPDIPRPPNPYTNHRGRGSPYGPPMGPGPPGGLTLPLTPQCVFDYSLGVRQTAYYNQNKCQVGESRLLI